MKKWLSILTAILLGVAVVDYFAIKSNFPFNLYETWRINNRLNTKQKPDAPTMPKDVLMETLRRQHHLRALTAQEKGKRLEELPIGTYGFSACSETLEAERGTTSTLEIQKRHDRIDYYVGYASHEDIEKYLSRQKNFHVRMSSYPSDKHSSLFEIPLYFVSKCEVRTSKDGDHFDLFVRDIPELQS